MTPKSASIFPSNLAVILLLFGLILVGSVKADHYYGGYFYYTFVADKTIEITLVTYTDEENDRSDRDSVEFQFGDGNKGFLIRENGGGAGESVYPGVRKNKYVGQHEYLSYKNYQPYFSDNYRVYDIKNIASGKSGVVSLRFDGIVPVQDTALYCYNSSPRPLIDPYFFGKSNQKIEINFAYHDQEGDSLSFELVESKGSNGKEAPDYFIPSGAAINSETGHFSWTPDSKGKFAFAFEVSEFRNGELIGKSQTDFTLFIEHPDYPSLSTGSYTASANQYSFSSAGTQSFFFEYIRSNADSVRCELASALSAIPGFNVSVTGTANGSTSKDTLELSYNGTTIFNGYLPACMHCTAYIGADSVLKQTIPLSIGVDPIFQTDCEVPDLSIVEETTPEIPAFTISPNLFEERVWVNVGSDFENLSLQVFDMRGRLVRAYDRLWAETIKLNLSSLSAGMYILRIEKDETEIYVGKMVKK